MYEPYNRNGTSNIVNSHAECNNYVGSIIYAIGIEAASFCSRANAGYVEPGMRRWKEYY
jgi:hypothetical protein